MNSEIIMAAPQADLSGGLFGKWLETHTGTEEDFFRFMTRPSADRSLFLGGLEPELSAGEGVATATYG